MDCDDDLNFQRASKFHFADNSNRQRVEFLDTVTGFEFESHIFVVDKAALLTSGYRSGDGIYDATLRMALRVAASTLEEATVVMDGTGDRSSGVRW